MAPKFIKKEYSTELILAELFFADTEKLSLLNSFVHPVTFADAASWMQNQKTPYAVKEAALIFEAGLENFFDYIIGVTAPESLRLETSYEQGPFIKRKCISTYACSKWMKKKKFNDVIL